MRSLAKTEGTQGMAKKSKWPSSSQVPGPICRDRLETISMRWLFISQNIHVWDRRHHPGSTSLSQEHSEAQDWKQEARIHRLPGRSNLARSTIRSVKWTSLRPDDDQETDQSIRSADVEADSDKPYCRIACKISALSESVLPRRDFG